MSGEARCWVPAIVSVVSKQRMPEGNCSRFSRSVGLTAFDLIQCEFLAPCFLVQEIGRILPQLGHILRERVLNNFNPVKENTLDSQNHSVLGNLKLWH